MDIFFLNVQFLELYPCWCCFENCFFVQWSR